MLPVYVFMFTNCPGEEYVDIILCDGYNRFGTSPDHTVWKSFKEVFGIGYDRMALLPGNKPLGAGETSTVSAGGDKIQWIQDAFESLRDDFPRVAEV
jgi:beta-mannanase